MGNNNARSSAKATTGSTSACCGSVQYAPNNSNQERSKLQKLKRKSVPNLTAGDFYQNMGEGKVFSLIPTGKITSIEKKGDETEIRLK
jgi:hypothetical protein